jgi:hypothetical protein
MSAVRFIQNPSTLGHKIAAPGGRKISEVIESGQAAVDSMAAAGLQALDNAIAAIAAALDERSTTGTALPEAVLERIYRQSADIHASAAVFGLADMGEAAWSLCELIDTGAGGPRTGRDAVVSHLNSLRLLRQGEAVQAEHRRALLQGLEDLRLHTRQEAAGG